MKLNVLQHTGICSMAAADGSSLRTTLLRTVLNSLGTCDIRGMMAVASAYLKQVKDAIAEAYNKHASSPVIVNCRDLCPSLIEEVLGPQTPSSSCSHQTTNQSCMTQTQTGTDYGCWHGSFCCTGFACHIGI